MEIDREKVIKGLECCAVPGGNCLECPYGKYGVDSEGLECENKLAADALELLKAQEPIEMTLEEAHAKLEKYGIKRYYLYPCAVGGDERGMIDREKVIAGLEKVWDALDHMEHGLYADYVYDSLELYADYVYDALEFLKAQEPRVMTLYELRQLEHTDHIIWVEANGDPESFDGYAEVTTNLVTKDIELFVPGNEVEFIPDNKNYGKTWRCWSSRPTDEQREAVKWDV